MDADGGFAAQLQAWGNSRRAALFWGSLGCVCSFLFPLFLFADEGNGVVGDVGCIRLMMMFLSCAAAAALYRLCFMLRHEPVMRERPSEAGRMLGIGIWFFMYLVVSCTFLEAGTWPNVVGLQLLVVAFFVLLEMGRPMADFHMLHLFVVLPIVAGGRRYGWDFVPFGVPMFVAASIFIMWRDYFLVHVGAPS